MTDALNEKLDRMAKDVDDVRSTMKELAGALRSRLPDEFELEHQNDSLPEMRRCGRNAAGRARAGPVL